MNEENTVFQKEAVEPPHVSFSFFTILKLIVGLLVFIIVAFVAIRFVLPNFGGEKNGKVNLVYWGLWEDENTMKVIISDFERENPKISVNYSKQDIKQYRQRLTTRSESGTGPDIFQFHNTWISMLKNVLVPLPEDVISKTEFQKEFYPVIQKDLIKSGAIYGIPVGIDTLSLFVNTEILKAAGVDTPTTWEEFQDVSRTLTVKDETGQIKTAGAAMGTFDNITHAPDIVSLLFAQNGADINNLSQDSDQASDALRFYASFANDEARVWDETLDPSRLAFAKGNLAMYFGYSWDIFVIKALNPQLSFAIYPVPRLPGREKTIASYWANGAAKSKHQKEALSFMKFLSKKDTEQKLFTQSSKTRLFGQPYGRISLANSLKDNIYVYPFVQQAPFAVSSFFVSDTFDDGLNDQMNAYLGNAVRSVLGNTSPQSAVETLAAGVSQVLDKYNENR